MKVKVPITIPNELLIKSTNLVVNNYPNLDLKKRREVIKGFLDIFSFIRIKEITNIEEDETYEYKHIYTYEFEKVFKRTRPKGYDIHHSSILSDLDKMGFIKINPNYKYIDKRDVSNFNSKYDDKIFPKSYKTINFENINVRKHYINFNENIKDILSMFHNTKEDWLKIYPDYKVFIENSYKVNIDLDKYSEYLESNLNNRLKRDSTIIKTHKSGSKYKVSKPNYLTYKKIDSYLFKALKINLGLIWFKVSSTGRLYSSLTNLSSTHIPFLRYNKIDNFTYLDAKNCQPLILSNRLDNKKYKEVAESGLFYETIQSKYNEMYNENKSRTDIKGILYKDVFFDDNSKVSKKIKDVFDSLFGEDVVIKINDLKNNKISHITQTIESDVFINDFKDWNSFIISRHDGLFVLKNDKERALNLLNNSFKKYDLIADIDDRIDSKDYYDSFIKK